MYISETTQNPRARYWHHLIQTSPDHDLVLFSGDGGHGYLSDTWIYSFVDQKWERISTADSPVPRVNGAAAYDPGSGKLILFGGLGEGFNVLGDTWLFSIKDKVWIEVE
jgi:hypothetical protein